MNLIKYIIKTSANYKKLIFGMVFSTFVVAIDANLRPYVIKLLIDQSSAFNINTFVLLGVIYVVSQICSVIASGLFDWCGTLYHTHYRESVAHSYLKKLSNYSYKFFQETQSGTITSRITDAFNSIPVVVFFTIQMFIQFILLTAISTFILIKISYTLALLVFVWIFVFIVLTKIHIVHSRKLNKEYVQSRTKIFGFLSDYFTNILSVWFFTNKQTEYKNLNDITKQYVGYGVKFGIFLRNYYFSYGIIVSFYMSGILCVLGYLSLKKAITPGDFALVFLINYKIAEKLLEISYRLVEFIQTFTIASNAIELLSKEEEIDSGYGVLENKTGDIVFDNITFGYEKTKILFQNLSLTIKNKQNIGIVGYSGSGKSTLTNLILRLYSIQNGKILINGNDINDISKESLYQNIGLIPQEPTLFNRTIFENIAYGIKNASLEQVIDAAKQAEAHTFISNLPDGYNTLVGERGMKLSGGQRQRMVIARTILKNAPILVMDEATSSLDAITENAIRDFLINFAKAKTSIVIAHRISTLLNMDRILVLDNGKIAEDGTHSELIAKNGLYTKMWFANSNGFLGINSDILS